MKLSLAGILALSVLSVLSAGPVSAQTTDTNDTAREQLRRDTQRQLLMENASREQRRLIQLQRLRDSGSSRRQAPRPPESTPANPQRGTVRTQ